MSGLRVQVRGDDDVLALLNEMDHETTTNANTSNSVALIPASGERSESTETHGSFSSNSTGAALSNPPLNSPTRSCHHDSLTKLRSHFSNAYQLSPPSNPQVEIIRHRCHEKFKTNFNDAFRSCVAKSPSSNEGHQSCTTVKAKRNQFVKSVIETVWSEMTAHNIWERYQFSLKTLEAECIRESQQILQPSVESPKFSTSSWMQPWFQMHTGTSDFSSLTDAAAENLHRNLIQQLLCPTVHQVNTWIVHGRNNGTLWEPLLPVSSIFSSDDISNNHPKAVMDNEYPQTLQQINSKYRRGTLAVLKKEVKFQFRRTFKQILGKRDRQGNSDKSTKKTSLSLNTMHSALLETSNSTGVASEGGRSKSSSKYKIESSFPPSTKEDFVLESIFQSDPFQRATQKLHKKFQYLAEESFSTFLAELKKCCNRLTLEEQAQHQRQGSKQRKQKRGKRKFINIPKIIFLENDYNHSGQRKNSKYMDRQASVSFGGISLRINEFHLNKLQSLFERTLHRVIPDFQNHHQQYLQYLQFFPQLLFVVLLRYDALQGAGLQSAIPPAVFRTLNERYGCDWECFASPFNCWVETNAGYRAGGMNVAVGGRKEEEPQCGIRGGNYGCAFGDIDAWFGGAGSFFGMDFLSMAEKQFKSGRAMSFQANPPFASDFMHSMYKKMDHFLSVSMEHESSLERKESEACIPIMFIVIVPAWKESEGWKSIASSPFLTKHVFLGQKENVHYYAEGTQHRRQLNKGVRDVRQSKLKNSEADGIEASHRIASFDTSIFFLQNEAAKAMWPLSDEDDSKLKLAFAATSACVVDDARLPAKALKANRGTLKTERKHTQLKISCNIEREDSLLQTQPNQQSKKSKKSSHVFKKKKKQKLMLGGQDEQDIISSLGIASNSAPFDSSCIEKIINGNPPSNKKNKAVPISKGSVNNKTKKGKNLRKD